MFLHYTSLFLAVAALLWWKRGGRKWMWLGIFLLFLWLSIGPVLHVYGHRVERFPCLYNLFVKLPFAGMGRAPYRFLPGALVSLAVLAALGVVAIQERFGGNRRRVGIAIALLVFTPLALESAHFFVPHELAPSAAEQYLARDPDSYAIIIAAQRSFMSREAAMFGQITHRKRIDTGYIPRFHKGLSHPLSSPAEHVLAKVEKAMHDGSFRYVLCPKPQLNGTPDRGVSRDLEYIKRIYAWLDEHISERKDFGDEVLFRLGDRSERGSSAFGSTSPDNRDESRDIAEHAGPEGGSYGSAHGHDDR